MMKYDVINFIVVLLLLLLCCIVEGSIGVVPTCESKDDESDNNKYNNKDGVKLSTSSSTFLNQVISLPYDKGALEPYISRETLEYHYEKHHKVKVNITS